MAGRSFMGVSTELKWMTPKKPWKKNYLSNCIPDRQKSLCKAYEWSIHQVGCPRHFTWLECGEFEDKRKEMGQASRTDQIRKHFTGPIQEFGLYTEGNVELPEQQNEEWIGRWRNWKWRGHEEGSLQKNCGTQGHQDEGIRTGMRMGGAEGAEMESQRGSRGWWWERQLEGKAHLGRRQWVQF